MNNSQNFGNEKTANLVKLIESVQPIIPDELITEIAETIVSLFKSNGETSFLISAVGEEMQEIADRYESPSSTVHDNRRRREVTATTAILDFVFRPKADVFSVRVD